MSTLNGNINTLATKAKGGKLGFVYDFLDNLFKSLDLVSKTMGSVQKARRDKGAIRLDAISSTQTAKQAMEIASGKKGFGAGKEAQNSQNVYLEAETHLVEILEAEAVEDAILNILAKMLDYVRSARESIDSWQQSLALSPKGLYAKLQAGRQQVNSDRAADKDIKCRKVINDPGYEKKRYTDYINSVENGWINSLLNAISWEMETKVEGARQSLNVRMMIAQPDGVIAALNPNQVDDNLYAWLQLSRQPFNRAKEEESVIRYLVDNDEYRDVNKLAEEIYNYSGVPLRFDGGDPLRANFLRAFFQTSQEAGHRDYLRSLIASLAQKSGTAVLDVEQSSSAEESKFGKLVNSEDRFKFTLVFTQELIQLDNIHAYSKTGLKEYLGGDGMASGGDRRVLHIFPAEVHAAEYESRLPELKQKIRLFSDDVVLQLEDLEQFRLFLMCYAYGMIRRLGVKTGASASSKQVWVLQIPPEKENDEFGNLSESKEIWLTDPDKEASIHDALMTFNFVGKDVGHGESYNEPIDYKTLPKVLARVRELDTRKRVEAGTAGNGDPLAGKIARVSDAGSRSDLLMEIARIDRIREAYENVTKNVLPAVEGNLHDPDKQKEYDIASVFALMLGDELKGARRNIEDRIDGSYGL
jgi:hypothetical protein